MSRTVKEDNLPKLKHKLVLTEENGKIVLDISDTTGGLGLRLYLDPSIASKLGQRMADRARFTAACESNDPKRQAIDKFEGDLAIDRSRGQKIK